MTGRATRSGRTLSRAASAFLLALAAGCGTFVAHPGPPLPDSEVATVHCYVRYYFLYLGECHVSAVDGRRPGLGAMMNLTTRVTPGRHWVEIQLAAYFGGAGGPTDTCAFDHEFEAGRRYDITAHSLRYEDTQPAKDSSAGLYSASLELQTRAPNGKAEVRRIPATCSLGGTLCRQVSDCEPHPDMRCAHVEGAPFGMCVLM